MQTRIPWRAWYGDEDLTLDFPDTWEVTVYRPEDGPEIDDAAVEAAFDHPIESEPLEALARACTNRGAGTVSIAVDDISRPTPAARLMPALIHRLERGGVNLQNVRVVMGIGMHRPMIKGGIVKKLGQYAADRLDVHNNTPFGNLMDFGTSDRGTPIRISRYFGEADLKIGVGGVLPHDGPGFSGGAKVVFPGVASFETVTAMHRPERFRGGLIDVETNDLRAEIEDMGRKVGLDFIVNAVTNTRRQIAGLFTGDMVAAHRAAVSFAKPLYATPMPKDPVDVAITSAYPKDTDFLQAGHAMDVLKSAALAGETVLKPDATVVIITASPEGRGYHSVYGPGMIYDARREDWRDRPSEIDGHPLVVFSPTLTPQDAQTRDVFQTWNAVIERLSERYARPRAAVFPCGAMQITSGRVG